MEEGKESGGGVMMTGWRDFCIKMTDEVRRELVIAYLDIDSRNVSTVEEDGFYFIHLWGYGLDEESMKTNGELKDILRKSREAGYYIEANDTTDTGDGLVRFEKDSDLRVISDLVEDEDLGEQLTYFQMDAPYWGDVYQFLGGYFPAMYRDDWRRMWEERHE